MSLWPASWTTGPSLNGATWTTGPSFNRRLPRNALALNNRSRRAEREPPRELVTPMEPDR